MLDQRSSNNIIKRALQEYPHSLFYAICPAHQLGMTDPISLTGAITAAIKILNLAAQAMLSLKGNVEEYHLLGTQLQEYQESFQLSKFRLDSWCKVWRIWKTKPSICRCQNLGSWRLGFH